MKTYLDYEFIYRDCGGDPVKIQRRIDRAIAEAERVREYDTRLRAVALATVLKKRIQELFPLKKGDRVRYYGAFNEDCEVVNATVDRVTRDLVYVTMDKYIDNNGKWVKRPCSQWAHAKQLRKLRKKNV